MSGNLAQRLRGTIESEFLDLGRFKFGTLYSLGKDHGIPALCDFSDGLGDAQFEWHSQLPPNARGKTVIDIDRRAYFPLEIHETPVQISAGINPEAKQALELLNTYRNTGLFSVHRDCYDLQGDRERHHAIFTDVLAILHHPSFHDKFLARLRALPSPPALIIVPPHHAGKGLAEGAQAFFKGHGHDVPVFIHPDLDFNRTDLEPEAAAIRATLQKLSADQSILILDDVSVTGRRLTRYEECLRAIDYAGGIDIVIALARPSSKAEWDRRVRQLRFRQDRDKRPYTVECVEFLILPDWETEDCPWCCEKRLYSRLFEERGTVPQFLAARSQKLASKPTVKGLVDDLFLTGTSQGGMTFNGNSALLKSPATQADVFVAVASAIQRLRMGDDIYRRGLKSEWQPRLEPHFPQITFLSVENYFGDRFSEGVLRASVLRAALQRDLESPTTATENERSKRTKEVLLRPKSPRDDLSFEIMLAIEQGKLPPVVLEPQEHAMLEKRSHYESLDVLRTAGNGG